MNNDEPQRTSLGIAHEASKARRKERAKRKAEASKLEESHEPCRTVKALVALGGVGGMLLGVGMGLVEALEACEEAVRSGASNALVEPMYDLCDKLQERRIAIREEMERLDSHLMSQICPDREEDNDDKTSE